MIAKEYLSAARGIPSRLENMALQIQSLDDALTKVSQKLTDTPRAVSPSICRMETLITAKVDLERKMREESAKLAEIVQAINSLPNSRHSSILAKRYVAGMGWDEISFDLHICKGHVHALHRAALAELEKSLLILT